MATRKLVEGVLIDDAARHMESRSVFRAGYVLELEILFRGADDLFRRDYHLLYPRGVDSWKAVSNTPTAIGRDRAERRCYGFAEAAGETAGRALSVGKTLAPESGAAETPGEV